MEEIKCPVCEKSSTACYTVCVGCYERIWDEIVKSRQKIKELEVEIQNWKDRYMMILGH